MSCAKAKALAVKARIEFYEAELLSSRKEYNDEINMVILNQYPRNFTVDSANGVLERLKTALLKCNNFNQVCSTVAEETVS